MKKTITVILLAAMLVSTVACTKQSPASSDSATDTTETTAATETVVTTAAETTDATTETAAKFDINAPENYMFRLLDMTAAEIETEYGMTFNYIFAGASPVFNIAGKKTEMCFPEVRNDDGSVRYKEVAGDTKPGTVRTTDSSEYVYPGLKVGMTADQVRDVTGNFDNLSYGQSEWIPGFFTQIVYEGYHIDIVWKVSDELTDEVNSFYTSTGISPERENFLAGIKDTFAGDVAIISICK